MTFPRLGTPRAPGPVLPARRGAGAECDAGAGSAPGGGGSGDRGSAPLLPGRDPHAAARPGRRSLAEQGEGEAARGGAEAGSGGLKARDPRTHPRGARAGWAATSGPARSAPCRSCSSRSRRCPGAEPAPPPPRAAAGTPTAPRALRPPPGAPFPPRRPPGRSRGCRASPGAWRSRGLGGVRGSGRRLPGSGGEAASAPRSLELRPRCHSNRAGLAPGGRRGAGGAAEQRGAESAVLPPLAPAVQSSSARCAPAAEKPALLKPGRVDAHARPGRAGEMRLPPAAVRVEARGAECPALPTPPGRGTLWGARCPLRFPTSSAARPRAEQGRPHDPAGTPSGTADVRSGCSVRTG